MKLFAKEHFSEIECINSTNTYLLEHCEELPDGYVLTALEQTEGKGRLGRNWNSARGKGLYLSFLLKQFPAEHLLTMPLYIALCQVKALENLGVQGDIKWPNDLVIGGKKVGGVLCESKYTQSGIYLVVGIGVNLLQKEQFFQERELPYGGSLLTQANIEATRETVIEEILKAIEENWALLVSGKEELIAIYKKNCINVNKEVKLIRRGAEQVGFAKDITPQGGLVVQLNSGETVEVTAGEVSVRGLYGYV